MKQNIEAVRGMNDILPEQSGAWQHFETVLRRVARAYGYQEIRFPVVEKTELFKRSIGEVTDIVEKEMFTFPDRNNDSLTLRPEGTAGCARAGINNSLFYNKLQRLWYMGPMFRYENPQKGRYRQFHHFGIEAYGMPGPLIDAEVILFSARLWKELEVSDQLELQINSLGSVEARDKYRQKLVTYFKDHFDKLDADSKRRLESNPLRILDSKNPEMKHIVQSAPKLLDHLDEESLTHFNELQRLLRESGISFTVNPQLVRGLDYYNRTVFEWVTREKIAQNTVCAGGRYDGLVAQLGGDPVPAVGFALGMERVLSLITNPRDEQLPQIYFISVGDAVREKALLFAEQLRDKLPNIRLMLDCAEGGFKNQFKRADKSGADLALILGEDEAKAGIVNVKFLREDKPQVALKAVELVDYLRDIYSS